MVYTREEFVKKYGDFINRAVEGTGILAGTLIAQAIIESQGKVGNVYKVGASKLAREANNYFGIKADSRWKGAKYNISTGEYTPQGKYYVEEGASFRSYSSVKNSIKDYVSFLKNNPRYEKAGVFRAKTVKQQAEALKNAGYATSPTYATMIDSVYKGFKGVLSTSVSFARQNWWAFALVGIGAVGVTVYLVKSNNN